MEQIPVTPIQRATSIIGGAAKVANITGVSVTAVYQWLDGSRPVPAARAPLIERATGGHVTAEELCPSVPWDIVRNAPEAAA